MYMYNLLLMVNLSLTLSLCFLVFWVCWLVGVLVLVYLLHLPHNEHSHVSIIIDSSTSELKILKYRDRVITTIITVSSQMSYC